MTDKNDRLRELIKAYRRDPAGFCREFLGFEPHVGQERWLTDGSNVENALVTGNRWGKSYIAAAKAIFKCCYRIGWTTDMKALYAKRAQPYHAINVSYSADQAKLVWMNAFRMLQGDKAQWLVKDSKLTPFPRIIFFNGAILEARSTGGDGARLLGNSYDHVNWDEAALEKRFEVIRDNVLRMRVVDRRGTIDYTSTGQGRNPFGLYFLTGLPGDKKDPNLYSQTGQTWENPNIDQDLVKRNASRMSDRMRRQNIEGLIVEAGGSFFDGVDVEAAFDRDLDLRVVERDEEEKEAHAVVFQGGKPWVEAFPDHRYVHGWDLANKKDWAVGQTWDTSVKPKTCVHFERFRRQGWAHVYDRIRTRHRGYANSSTWLDATGVGDVVLEELGDIGAQGVVFTGKSKPELLANLQSLLSLRELRVPLIRVFRDEVFFYEEEDEQLITDCVMSLAVAANSPEMRHTGEAWYFSEID